LWCRPKRRFKRTTDSNHPHPVYDNHWKDKELTEPGQAWVAERTCSWLSHNRRLVRDYERKRESAVAFIYVSMYRLLLTRLAKQPL
jgi:transposase